MTNPQDKPAQCEAWAQARQSGTDHELYGPAIDDGGGASHSIGNVPCIRFCPWCGTPLPDARHE